METPLPLQCNDGTLQGTVLLQWSESMQKLGEAVGCHFDYRQWIEIRASSISIAYSSLPNQPVAKGQEAEENWNLGAGCFVDGPEGFSAKLYASMLGWTGQFRPRSRAHASAEGHLQSQHSCLLVSLSSLLRSR
jgi:hypothetical protein